MKTSIYFFIIIATSLFLSACAARHPYDWQRYEKMSSRGAKVGAVSGAVVGSLSGVGFVTPLTTIMGGLVGRALVEAFEKRRTMLEKLEAYGVKIIYLGDDVKIMLPTDVFFYYESNNPSPVFYKNMDLIVAILRHLDKITVKVSGYTDSAGSPERDAVLSKEQAQIVADYLWDQQIDARLVYAIGYGQAFPIANNITRKGQSQNRRIEIDLRRIVDP